MAKKKCKRCGRHFESKGTGDAFCSPICRMTGFFIGGGGDTTKPGVARKGETIQKPEKVVRVKKDDEKFARVRQMFQLPETERWAIAKDFSPEERAYAKRLARRKLMEDDRLTREWTWETSEDGDVEAALEEAFGDSDDGSL